MQDEKKEKQEDISNYTFKPDIIHYNAAGSKESKEAPS